MKKWIKGVSLLLLVLAIQACMKDFKDVDNFEVSEWQPELAVALINTTVSIDDVLDDFEDQGYLNVDSENFMTIVYQGNIFSASGEEVAEMPDFTVPMFSSNISFPYNLINTPFDIDFFSIRSGKLDYSFQSPHTEDITVVFEIKNLTKGGTPLEFSAPVQFTGSSPENASGSIDLAGYVLDFIGDEVEISYTATNNAGETRTLDNVMLDFKDFEYDFAQGFFGQYEYNLPTDTIKLDIFEDAVSGSLFLEDPKIKVIIHNSFGTPIRMTSNGMMANTVSGGNMNLTTVLDDGVDFEYPTLLEVGEIKTTNIEINNTNSNLAEVISKIPQEIQFSMNAISNPENDPNTKGFVKYDSRFDVDLELEVPVHFRAEDFVFETTTELDTDIFEDIESAEFKLITENGLPIDAGVQVYFLDANNMVLDSLFNNVGGSLIPSAKVDANGRVTSTSTGEHIAEISANRIQNFENATQIAIHSILSTTDGGNTAAKFYTDYSMTFQLGVKAKVKE